MRRRLYSIAETMFSGLLFGELMGTAMFNGCVFAFLGLWRVVYYTIGVYLALVAVAVLTMAVCKE